MPPLLEHTAIPGTLRKTIPPLLDIRVTGTSGRVIQRTRVRDYALLEGGVLGEDNLILPALFRKGSVVVMRMMMLMGGIESGVC